MFYHKYCNVEYKMVTELVICFLREKKHIAARSQRRKHQNSVEVWFYCTSQCPFIPLPINTTLSFFKRRVIVFASTLYLSAISSRVFYCFA